MLGLRRTPARLRGTVKAALGPSLTRSIRPLLPALSPLATYDLQQVPNSFEKCAGVPAVSTRHFSTGPDEKKAEGEGEGAGSQGPRGLTFLKEYGRCVAVTWQGRWAWRSRWPSRAARWH